MSMARVLCIMTLLLLLATTQNVSAQTKTQPRKPNIVMLYADDLGWGDVSFNGRREWRTPNLDRLAKQGTLFKRWYTGAVVCAPSRAALMTGKYGIHSGVSGNGDDIPRNEITIPKALKSAGYRTALFGKWHGGATRPGETESVHPLDFGFDTFMGFRDAVHAWEHFPKELWFGREKRPVSGWADTLFADQAVQFIQKNKSQPFFLYVAFNAPHFHIEAPEADLARFRGRFSEKDPNAPYNAAYAAMITRLDAEVGRIVRQIDAEGLAEETLIVFSSDHGATFEVGSKEAPVFHDSNRPFRGQKRTLWEGGIRVPGIARWKGHIPAGSVSKDTVHMIDMLPTFLSAAGEAPRAEWNLDGRNLLSYWTTQTPAPSVTHFWEWRSEGRRQLAAMTGDLKLVITGDQPEELFDVSADPGERRSLRATRPEVADRLRKELLAWLATETEASKWGKSVKNGDAPR